MVLEGKSFSFALVLRILFHSCESSFSSRVSQDGCSGAEYLGTLGRQGSSAFPSGSQSADFLNVVL